MTANHDLSDAESPWPRRGRSIGTVVGRPYGRLLRIGTGKGERGRQAAAAAAAAATAGDKTARWGSGEAEGSRRAEARASSSSLPRRGHGPVDSNDAGGSPRAIFTYGTLRADYSPTGDRWGVMEAISAEHRVGCEWRRASVQGWSLFQERGKDYPFACAATEGSVVWGTLLTWPSDDAFADALRRCDRIEGFVPGGDGLYAREVVAAESPDGVVKAYMYYQDCSSVEKMAHCLAFPEGDWLLGTADRTAR